MKELTKKLRPENENIISSLFKGLKEITGPLQGILKPKLELGRIEKMTRDSAKSKSASNAYLVYLVYKKSHGMVSE